MKPTVLSRRQVNEIEGETEREPRTSVKADVGELVAGLLDVEFQTILTTRLLPAVYVAAMAGIAIALVLVVVVRFGHSFAEGVLWLLAAPIAYVILLIAVRVVLEVVITLFRIAFLAEKISGQASDIAADLPRIQFWKRRPERS